MAALHNFDWRTRLDPQTRSRIIDKIVDILERHLPTAGGVGIAELRNIATRFEKKIFLAAASQADYLRRISMKMLTMEHNHHGPNGPDQAFNIPPYDEF